jgi:hypothetical protein
MTHERPEPWKRLDPALLDEAVLAILYYNATTAGGAWKTLPWDATGRLHEAELISNPAEARKSVELYEEGFEKGRAAFERLFARKEG